MKKLKMFASCLLLSGLVLGCSCSKDVDTHANVSYEGKTIANSNKLTVGDLYEYIHKNQRDVLAKRIFLDVMKNSIDFTNEDIANLYKSYLNEKMKSKYVDNKSYQYYDEFDEELLVDELRAQSYDIKCGEGFTAGDLDSKYFTCDYSSYIESELNYDIYLDILKVQYLINEKPEAITNSQARKVTYYSVSRGTNDDALNKLKTQVKSISENYNAADDTVKGDDSVRNIIDIATLDKNDDLKQIDTDYGYLRTATDSPSFSHLKKFTTCSGEGEEVKRCSIEEGLAYLRNKKMEEKFYTTEIVTKENTSILFEDARKVLFSSNIEDYLRKIGDKYYLVNPASYDETDERVTDIILYEGTTENGHSSSSKYYLVEVEIIDGSNASSFADKVEVAELLIGKVNNQTIYEDCFDEVDLEIYDEDIRNKFIESYSKFKGE